MNQENKEPEKDSVEAVVKHMHIVLPIVGAVLMFMLAFIAVTMAWDDCCVTQWKLKCLHGGRLL